MLLNILFLSTLVSLLRRRPDRPGLDELGFDCRLAGILFPLTNIPNPIHDAVRHRAAAPAEMSDRWPALLEIRVVVAADQGKISRHLNVLAE